MMGKLYDILIDKLLRFSGSQKFLSVQLDITNACNLRCIHCYQSLESGNELPLSDWLKILDQYQALGKKLRLKPYFVISGGEPTISPLFSPILNEIHNRWASAGVDVLTNGTMITPAIASEIQAHKAGVQISLDGPTSEQHDVFRGVGSYARALQGAHTLKMSGVSVTFQSILSYRTKPWIADYYAATAAAGVKAMNFTRFMPQGRGKTLQSSNSDRALSANELKDAYIDIISSSRKTGISTNMNLPLFTLLDGELGAHSKAGFQGLVVDSRGYLKVTSRADFRLGNILEEGLDRLFLDHQIMKDLRSGKIDECGVCKHYDRCGGDRTASFAVHGSFLKKDPCCWL